jgi:translation elongation factor P/translation initiation factor 5A
MLHQVDATAADVPIARTLRVLTMVPEDDKAIQVDARKKHEQSHWLTENTECQTTQIDAAILSQQRKTETHSPAKDKTI